MIPAQFGPPVRAGRVLLRTMSADDIDDVHAYQGRDDVCRYLLFEARTREQVAEQVARHAASAVLAADGDYWQIAVVLPASGHQAERVIGDIYFTLKSGENLAGEIGWTFHPDFWGRGYATEAASAVLRRALPPAGHARGGLLREGPDGQGRLGRHRHLCDSRRRVDDAIRDRRLRGAR